MVQYQVFFKHLRYGLMFHSLFGFRNAMNGREKVREGIMRVRVTYLVINIGAWGHILKGMYVAE